MSIGGLQFVHSREEQAAERSANYFLSSLCAAQWPAGSFCDQS